MLGLGQMAISFNHTCGFRHIPLMSCPWAVSIRNTLWDSRVRCIQPGSGYSLIHGCVWPQRLWFLFFLLRNGLSILAVVVLNRIWYLHLTLELGTCVLEEATFSSLSRRASTKPFTICLSYGTNYVWDRSETVYQYTAKLHWWSGHNK